MRKGVEQGATLDRGIQRVPESVRWKILGHAAAAVNIIASKLWQKLSPEVIVRGQ